MKNAFIFISTVHIDDRKRRNSKHTGLKNNIFKQEQNIGNKFQNID